MSSYESSPRILTLFADIIIGSLPIGSGNKVAKFLNEILKEYGLKSYFSSDEYVDLFLHVRDENIPDQATIDIINFFFMMNPDINYERQPEYFNYYAAKSSNIRIIGEIQDELRNLRYYAGKISQTRKMA